MVMMLLVLVVAGKRVGKWLEKDVSEYKGLLWWMLISVVGVVFLMTSASLAFWEGYEALRFLQYPWRLGMVMVWVATLMTMLLLSLLKTNYRAWLFGFLVGMMVVVWLVAKPSKQIDENTYQINDEWSYDRWYVVDVEEGYLPRSVVATASARPVFVVKEGEVSGSKLFEKAHELQVVLEATTSGRVEINRYDYPGWKLRVGEQVVEHDMTDEGLIGIRVDEGESLVTLRFERTWWRWLAEGVTLASVALVGVLWWKWRKS
jgi:hypothetical protein